MFPDDHELEELRRRREHAQRMRRAGERFGKLVDAGFSGEQQRATRNIIFGALRQKYGLDNDDENPPAA